jgi:hypothetical protein
MLPKPTLVDAQASIDKDHPFVMRVDETYSDGSTAVRYVHNETPQVSPSGSGFNGRVGPVLVSLALIAGVIVIWLPW